MIKAAVGGHHLVQHVLACVAKGRMTKVVCQCNSFCQLAVQPKRTCDRAGHLGYLDRVRQARAKIIALVFDENLCFVFQPAKRAGVNNTIPITLKT